LHASGECAIPSIILEVSVMADSGIKVRIEGELAYIALNRPEKRNAINQAMLRALP
jgi:hypothetical protein